MDDKVSSTYAILLMIIIAPRHAPKGGASVVVGACFCARHGFPMSSLPEFADLETLLCQGNFSADAARTRRSGARTAHSAGANQPFRSSASQPAQVVQKREVAYHLRLSEIGPAGVINALHFVHDG